MITMATKAAANVRERRANAPAIIRRRIGLAEASIAVIRTPSQPSQNIRTVAGGVILKRPRSLQGSGSTIAEAPPRLQWCDGETVVRGSIEKPGRPPWRRRDQSLRFGRVSQDRLTGRSGIAALALMLTVALAGYMSHAGSPRHFRSGQCKPGTPWPGSTCHSGFMS